MTDQHGRKARGVSIDLNRLTDIGNAVEDLPGEHMISAKMLVAFIGGAELTSEQIGKIFRHGFDIANGQTAVDRTSVREDDLAVRITEALYLVGDRVDLVGRRQIVEVKSFDDGVIGAVGRHEGVFRDVIVAVVELAYVEVRLVCVDEGRLVVYRDFFGDRHRSAVVCAY